MPPPTRGRKRYALAAPIVLAVAGLVIASSPHGSAAQAAVPNRRPVCNNIYFNLPSAVGDSVTIPVTDVAADPDLTPIRLTDVFGGAPIGSATISDNGTPTIPNDDVLVFTRASSTRGSVTLYWTVSDGSLSAQCQAYGNDSPPPPGG